MQPTRRGVIWFGGLAAAALCIFGAMTQSPGVEGTRWDWLTDTYWIVKPDGLPAMVHTVGADANLPVMDQTVYHIDQCRYGYFSGRSTTQLGANAPTCTRLIGSVTPDGSLQLNFLTIANGAATNRVAATGEMMRVRGEWTMRNQMCSPSSDQSTFVLHWAHMYRVRPGDPEWQRLPFVNVSVPQFLGQCP